MIKRKTKMGMIKHILMNRILTDILNRVIFASRDGRTFLKEERRGKLAMTCGEVLEWLNRAAC